MASVKLDDNLKYVTVLLLVLAALVLNIGTTWPLTIRFYDWRLNYWCGALLPIALAVSVVLFGAALQRPLFKVAAWAVGAVLFSVFCINLLLIRMAIPSASDKEDPNLRLMNELQIKGVRFRLYENDGIGGMFAVPSADLRKEWDTPLGFKLVHSVWGSVYYCCDVSLRLSIGSIEVIDNSSGSIVGRLTE